MADRRFLFTQSYQQDAVNTFAPFVLSPLVGFSVTQYSPVSELDDFGFGALRPGHRDAQRKARSRRRLARSTTRSKNADLKTFYDPAIAPPTVVTPKTASTTCRRSSRWRIACSPRTSSTARSAAASRPEGSTRRPRPAAKPTAKRAPGTIEGGLKALFADGRVALNSAVFFIDWNDLQLNVPNLTVPGQILHRQRRRRLEQGHRVRSHGARRARRRRLRQPSATRTRPSATASFSLGRRRLGQRDPQHAGLHGELGHAVQSRAVNSMTTAYGRADVVISRRVQVRRGQLPGQDAFSLVNLRGGVRARTSSLPRAGCEPIQHHLHPGGVRLRPAHAVRVHRRKRRAAHVRPASGRDVLKTRGAERERSGTELPSALRGAFSPPLLPDREQVLLAADVDPAVGDRRRRIHRLVDRVGAHDLVAGPALSMKVSPPSLVIATKPPNATGEPMKRAGTGIRPPSYLTVPVFGSRQVTMPLSVKR